MYEASDRNIFVFGGQLGDFNVTLPDFTDSDLCPHMFLKVKPVFFLFLCDKMRCSVGVCVVFSASVSAELQASPFAFYYFIVWARLALFR